MKHGDCGVKKTREYGSWRCMKKRCYLMTDPDYPSHGGRGISVCPEWRDDFGRFLADVGRRPTPAHSLDRYPNNNGNYEPGNVRWATRMEQARNRRDNVVMELHGVSKTAAEWAAIIGVSAETLHKRASAGWDDFRALTTPSRRMPHGFTDLSHGMKERQV